MSQINRRHFIRQSAAAMGVLASGPIAFAADPPAPKRSCTDVVTLGKSGVKVTRLAFGTGTNGGSVQRELGQKKFTELVRHAYDRGIRYFDSADTYDGMHEMLAKALEGVDRGTYKLLTKMRMTDETKPMEEIDRFRKELNSDYFDVLLMHCMRTPDWPDSRKRQMDAFEEAKQKEIIRSHGASCHGLNPLRAMPSCDWLDVALVRINHDGTHMDGPKGEWTEQGNRDEAVGNIKKIHAAGTGVMGMKLIGNGDFTDPERREASIRFVMSLDCFHAYTVGFKSPAEIDEIMGLMDTYLNV